LSTTDGEADVRSIVEGTLAPAGGWDVLDPEEQQLSDHAEVSSGYY
jgi:hypothetical protein